MATPGLVAAINSILTQLSDIPLDWSQVPGAEKSRPDKLFQLVRMWDNQIQREQDGGAEEGAQGYLFEKPACFLELQMAPREQMAENVTWGDITCRMHIAGYQLDAGDDVGMDQNLQVFSFRDLVIQYMTAFTPENCSTLFNVAERQDYDHTGYYHYIVDMQCGFTDIVGSTLYPQQVRVAYKEPPTDLELNSEFAEPE